MKNIFLITLLMVVNLSCIQISHTELINDPDVIKVFSKEEIPSLELIVNFFDSFILDNTDKAKDINQSYYQYFEKLENSETIKDLSLHSGLLNSDATKALIKKLKDRGIFSEIWKYDYGFDFRTKDTLYVELKLNLQGKYVKLLELLGGKNKYFLEYYIDLQNNGTISPSNIAQFIKYFGEVKFQKEVNRLVFAVHYITIASYEAYK